MEDENNSNWIWIQEVFVKDNLPESVTLPNVPKDYQELCKYMGDYSLIEPIRNSQPRPGEYYQGTPKVGTHIYGRNLKGESCCIVIKDNTIPLRFKKPANLGEDKVRKLLQSKNADFDLTPAEINIKQKYEIFGYQPDPNDITKRRKVPVMELRFTSMSKMRKAWKKLCDDTGNVDVNDRTDAKNNDFGVWFLVERNPTPPSSWINLKKFSVNTNTRYTVCVHEYESFINDIDWNPKSPPPIPIPKSRCCSWDTEWSSRSRNFPSSRRDYPALVGALSYDTGTSPNDNHHCVIFSCRNSDEIPPIGNKEQCKVEIRQSTCPELMLIAFRDYCVLESDSLFVHGYNSDKFDFRWCSEFINQCCNLRPSLKLREFLWNRSPFDLIGELDGAVLEKSLRYFALSREPCPPSLLAYIIKLSINKLSGDDGWDADISDDKRYSPKMHSPPYIAKCLTLKKYHARGQESVIKYCVDECFWWFETVYDWHEEHNADKMKQIYEAASSDVNELATLITKLFSYQRLQNEPQWDDVDRHPFFYWSKIVTLHTPLKGQRTMIAKRESKYYKITGPGIIFYDLLTYAMNEIKDLKEFSLEALCRREGIEGKADFDVRVGFEIIERNRPKEMAEYVYYNYVDCLRPAQITHKRGFYLFHSVLSNITFTPLQKVFSNGASARVHDQIMRDLETKGFVDDMPRAEPPLAIFGFNYSDKKDINPRTQKVEPLYIFKIIGIPKSSNDSHNSNIYDDDEKKVNNNDEKILDILKKLPIDTHFTWAHKLNQWSKKAKRTALIFESDISRTAQLFIDRFGFKERAKGGNVFPPTPGYYRQPIATLDFTSLYPSVMLAFNLCYTTLVKDTQVIEKALEFERVTGIKIIYPHVIRDDRIHYFMKSPDPNIQFNSVIPSLLRNLLIARKKVKAELEDEKDPYLKMILDTKQLVIKICANSVYGFTGFMNGVLPCLEITETVTLNGRNMILACQNWIETREWQKFLYDAMLIDASRRLMLDIQNSALVVSRTKNVVFSFGDNNQQFDDGTLQVWKSKIQDKINKPDGDTDRKDLEKIQEWITNIHDGTNPLSKFIFALKQSMLNKTFSTDNQLLCPTNLNYQFLKYISPNGLESLKELITFDPLLTPRRAKVVYGDSVAFYTPVLWKYKNESTFHYDTIQTLANRFSWTQSSNQKDKGFVLFPDDSQLMVWSDKGWTQLKKIIRHKHHNKLYRIQTKTGIVDVTKDHSLLNEYSQKIQPTKLVIDQSKLLHQDLPVGNGCYNVKNAYAYGVYFGSAKAHDDHSFSVPLSVLKKSFDESKFYSQMGATGTKVELISDSLNIKFISPSTYKQWMTQYPQHKVSDLILGSDEETRRDFWEGYQTTVNNTLTQLQLAGLFYVVDSLGYQCTQSDDLRVTKIEEIEYDSNDFVYDFETSNHHFAAGIGKLIVHNTDSVMIDFGCYPDVNGRKVAFLLGYITSRNRTLTFCEQFATSDINLDLEKVSQPFYLMKKKRYISLEFIGGPLKKPKSNVRGTEEVRKDNCPLVVRLQKICRGFITEDKVGEIVPYLKKEMTDVIIKPPNGVPVYHDFKMSKSLKEVYANPNGVVQLQVNEKIRKRNPGAEYKTGDRVEFIYPKGDPNLPSSKRAEHYQYVVDNNIQIDYLYYLDQIIIRAMFRLLQYAVPQIEKVAFSEVRAFAERHRTGEQCLEDSVKFLKESSNTLQTLAFKPLPIVQPKLLNQTQRKRQINQLSIISNPSPSNKRPNNASNRINLSTFF